MTCFVLLLLILQYYFDIKCTLTIHSNIIIRLALYELCNHLLERSLDVDEQTLLLCVAVIHKRHCDMCVKFV